MSIEAAACFMREAEENAQSVDVVLLLVGVNM